MKGFAEGVSKAATKVEQAFEKAATRAAQRLGDPSRVSQSDVDDAWREFRETCKDTGSTASEAAREEFREHILKNLEASGLTKAEAEAWFADRWAQVKRLADKGLLAAPKVGLAVKAGWLALSAVGVGVVGLLVAPGAHREGEAFAGAVTRTDTRLDQAEFTLHLVSDQLAFQRMGTLLNLANVPPEVFTPAMAAPAVAAPYVPPPAIAALPAPVAAIAAQPVQVEISRGGQSYRGSTDVGRVYRAIPEARPQIEQQASRIEHDYDKPTDWNRVVRGDTGHEQEHHVNIDVDAGFASAHFHM